MATTQRKHTRAWNGWSCLLSIRKDKRHMENPLVTDYARTLLAFPPLAEHLRECF